MATLNWWTIKERAEDLGFEWKDVLSVYEEVRAEHNQWVGEAKALRKSCFEWGISKQHPAFWRGDQDLDNMLRFDELTTQIQHDFPWLALRDDANQQIFELLTLKNEDFQMTEDECFDEAIKRLQSLQSRGMYRKSSEVLCCDSDCPF